MGDVKHEEMKHNIPEIQIGKLGVTDSFIAEIKTCMKKKKILKIKILKSARTARTKEIAKEVAMRANANLEDVRGNTFTIGKR